jgi:hypothetical protein
MYSTCSSIEATFDIDCGSHAARESVSGTSAAVAARARRSCHASQRDRGFDAIEANQSVPGGGFVLFFVWPVAASHRNSLMYLQAVG